MGGLVKDPCRAGIRTELKIKTCKNLDSEQTVSLPPYRQDASLLQHAAADGVDQVRVTDEGVALGVDADSDHVRVPFAYNQDAMRLLFDDPAVSYAFSASTAPAAESGSKIAQDRGSSVPPSSEMKAELMILRMVFSYRWLVFRFQAGGPAAAGWQPRLSGPCVAAVAMVSGAARQVAGAGCGTRMAVAATAVAISSLWTRRNVTGIASSAIAPDIQRAAWNPPVSAALTVSPPRTSVA